MITLKSPATLTRLHDALHPGWRPGGEGFTGFWFMNRKIDFERSRSATWDGGGELELLQKHLQKQAAAVKRWGAPTYSSSHHLRFAFSRSSTLGSFSRMRKPGAKGEGVSSGPLVILTPPPSSSSGLSSTSRNFPQNGATDNMDPQPAQPFNNEPHPPNTSPSTPLIEDSGMCVHLDQLSIINATMILGPSFKC